MNYNIIRRVWQCMSVSIIQEKYLPSEQNFEVQMQAVLQSTMSVPIGRSDWKWHFLDQPHELMRRPKHFPLHMTKNSCVCALSGWDRGVAAFPGRPPDSSSGRQWHKGGSSAGASLTAQTSAGGAGAQHKTGFRAGADPGHQVHSHSSTHHCRPVCHPSGLSTLTKLSSIQLSNSDSRWLGSLV